MTIAWITCNQFKNIFSVLETVSEVDFENQMRYEHRMCIWIYQWYRHIINEKIFSNTCIRIDIVCITEYKPTIQFCRISKYQATIHSSLLLFISTTTFPFYCVCPSLSIFQIRTSVDLCYSLCMFIEYIGALIEMAQFGNGLIARWIIWWYQIDMTILRFSSNSMHDDSIEWLELTELGNLAKMIIGWRFYMKWYCIFLTRLL